MQSTTDYLIQTFWNLVQWGKTDGPTTAEVLSRACDTHVVKKEEDLRHVRQREDSQRKVLNEARHATEEAQASLNAQNRSLESCIDGLKERFRFLRDAINVALESSADEEPVETLRQLCVVAEEFSAKDFQQAVTTIEERLTGPTATTEVSANGRTVPKRGWRRSSPSVGRSRATSMRSKGSRCNWTSAWRQRPSPDYPLQGRDRDGGGHPARSEPRCPTTT